MKDAFKNKINSIIYSSIITCIFGLILVLFPKISIDTIGLIASTYIILYGLVLIYLDIKTSSYLIPFDCLLPGILSVILGILLLTMPSLLPIIFTIIIGIWIILSSINIIKISLIIKGENTPWITLLLLGILDMIAGLMIIFNPFAASISITVFTGLVIISHSIVNIINIFVIKKDFDNLEKTITKEFKKIGK